MLFSSVSFIFLFAPVVVGINCLLQMNGKKNGWWLIAASAVYYGLAQINALPVFLISLGVNFLFSKHIEKKGMLFFGVLFNLLFLGYFKYTNFLIDNVNSFFKTDFEFVKILLPLGISFFTFVQIAYLVDLARGTAKKMSFSEYVLFVSFFPQISAGPIVSYAEMVPQYRNENERLSWQKAYAALILFIIGFAKKKLADNYAFFANELFDGGKSSFAWAWLGTIGYTFQLYFDFSGYCDMGMAVAKMLNISLPVNFNSPYKADSIQDFWRRWHITLSMWLRDYLYIPLGGSRKGLARTVLNYFIVFLLGGFWHGAGWTFIVWGAMHGTALGIHRVWKMLNRPLPKIAGVIVTFLFIHLTWVFFRAATVEQGMEIVSEMFAPVNFDVPEWGFMRQYAVQCAFGILCAFAAPNSMRIFQAVDAEKKTFCFAVFLICFAVFLTVQANSSPVFLYFKF